MNQKIAIYGGAFNPPTLGHFYVINEIFNNSDIEKIIIVPSGYRDDKSYGIEKKHRKKIIEIFINDLKNKGLNIELNNYFFNNENKKETVSRDIDIYFKNILGCSPWHIFGTDISGEIKNWSGNPNKYIEKKLKKIFIPRKGFDFINKDLENYIIIKTDKEIDISSTDIRENIKNNISISNLVFKKINNYILDNNLYKNNLT